MNLQSGRGWTLFCQFPKGVIVTEFIHHNQRLLVRCYDDAVYEIFPDGHCLLMTGDINLTSKETSVS